MVIETLSMIFAWYVFTSIFGFELWITIFTLLVIANIIYGGQSKDPSYTYTVEAINQQSPYKKEARRISSAVKREVWRRDNGRCVQCGSNEWLEYDHIIPVSKGGSNTARNIQLLCSKCNSRKSDKIQ